jgi:hypothetical protein
MYCSNNSASAHQIMNKILMVFKFQNLQKMFFVIELIKNIEEYPNIDKNRFI